MLEYLYINPNNKISTYNIDFMLLQLKDLKVNQWIEPSIKINTRELNRELYTKLSILYTTSLWSMLLI